MQDVRPAPGRAVTPGRPAPARASRAGPPSA